jgi:DNA modification methylase
MPLQDSIFKLHNRDIRCLEEVISGKREFIDVTITSPPYFNLKSYGHEKQIGYGQKYDEYLNDLRDIFKQVYIKTKETGSLWLIVDTFSKEGNFVNLPFDIASKLGDLFDVKNNNEKKGWKLTDLIIWKKDKTLPYSRKGQFRNIFEYVLFFTKSPLYKFNVDSTRINDFSQLKEWWVKFPERYNPKGTVPTNVWEFPIPTQGVWGSKSLRHFNPLPPKLIERIILLTTEVDDVVFDPFAGSGTTLSVAGFLNRRWFGFELNKGYCEMHDKVMAETKKELAAENQRIEELLQSSRYLESTIINLRLIKYPKAIVRQLLKRGLIEPSKQEIKTIFAFSSAERENTEGLLPHKFLKESIIIIVDSDGSKLRESIDLIINKPPLSKFGIQPEIIVDTKADYVKKQTEDLEKMKLFLYSHGIVNKYNNPICFEDWVSADIEKFLEYHSLKNVPPIISNISVDQQVLHSWKSKERKHQELLKALGSFFE